MAGTTGALAWIAMEWKLSGKATTLGAASGAIAGLATVTPASGFVGPISASIIGLLAGCGCYLGIMAKNRFGYDDSLDVVGIHGVGGVIGLLAAGFFASTAVNPGASNGLFFGNPSQLVIQIIAIAATIIYTFVITFILLKVIDKLFGLRVTESDELEGLDLSQHGETAYTS
jgi:Amt family ammonium transporter